MNSELIRKLIVSRIADKHPGYVLHHVGEFESEADFAKYCWEKLEHNTSHPEYIDWNSFYSDLHQFGYVGFHALIVTPEFKHQIGGIVYGFELVPESEADEYE